MFVCCIVKTVCLFNKLVKGPKTYLIALQVSLLEVESISWKENLYRLKTALLGILVLTETYRTSYCNLFQSSLLFYTTDIYVKQKRVEEKHVLSSRLKGKYITPKIRRGKLSSDQWRKKQDCYSFVRQKTSENTRFDHNSIFYYQL